MIFGWIVRESDSSFQDEEPTIIIGGDAPARYDFRGMSNSMADAVQAAAGELGVIGKPEFEFLFRHIEWRHMKHREGRLPHHWSEFGQLVNSMRKFFCDDPQEFVRWMFELLDGVYAEQQEQQSEWGAAKAEFQKKTGTIVDLQNARLVVIYSDNPRVAPYARSSGEVDIVIQQLSSGHVQISAVREKTHIMPALARLIRAAEYVAEHDGRRPPFRDSELEQEGNLMQIRNWQFRNRYLLLNGTPRNQWVQPTRLTLDTISDLVREAITGAELAGPSSRYGRRAS